MIHELPPKRRTPRQYRPSDAYELECWRCLETVEIPIKQQTHHCPKCGAPIFVEGDTK
jgi:DNA-directed RNA polymerase subunit RPC12/RpoP